MTSLNEYTLCLSLPRLDFYNTEGCFWDCKNDPRTPPGANSLRLPNGTLFKVALEGPRSSNYVPGVCRNRKFVVQQDPGRGEYDNANQAVTQIRGKDHTPNSNAWIHVFFKVGDSWILADEMRRRADLSVPKSQLEITALKMAREQAYKGLTGEAAERQALSLLPGFIEVCRNMPGLGTD